MEAQQSWLYLGFCVDSGDDVWARVSTGHGLYMIERTSKTRYPRSRDRYRTSVTYRYDNWGTKKTVSEYFETFGDAADALNECRSANSEEWVTLDGDDDAR